MGSKLAADLHLMQFQWPSDAQQTVHLAGLVVQPCQTALSMQYK